MQFLADGYTYKDFFLKSCQALPAFTVISSSTEKGILVSTDVKAKNLVNSRIFLKNFLMFWREELAKFGYKSERNEEKLKNPAMFW
jgi:hypothetical protein